MWKILLSKSHFIDKNQRIGGKCDSMNEVIWINDKWIHTNRKDKVRNGKIIDIFSLSIEQRFIMILNHEVFHAVYHKRINNLFAIVSLLLFPIFLIDLFLLKWLTMSLIIILIFGTVVILLYRLEERFACKHGENYTDIDKKMFANLVKK
jgi:ABC-type multidrug transport system fused ATPase/permease subunit